MDPLKQKAKLLSDAINKTTEELIERCESSCKPENHSNSCTPSCYSLCPHLCYYSPETLDDDHPTQHSKMSSLLIAMIALLAATFLIICLYVAYVKLQARRRRMRLIHEQHQELNPRRDDDVVIRVDELDMVDHPIWYIRTVGLQPSIINSISVFKYKRGDGLVEGTECSVCLNEFNEDETLRILPKCSHAFHIPCIDTWLGSHTNCPMCRAPIVANSARAQTAEQEAENMSENGDGSSREVEIEEGTSEPRREMENGMRELRVTFEEDEELEVDDERKRDDEGFETEMHQPMRRSVSLDSIAASKINLEVANVIDSGKVSNLELVKVNGSDLGKRVCGNRSSSSRFKASSSVGRSLQNGSGFMRRSLSLSGQVLLSMYSRSQNSVLPL